MTPECEKYVSALERLLCLLRALAEQLVASRKEFVAMDLDGIYRRIAEQEELCRQIQSLQSSNHALMMSSARDEDPAFTERLRNVTREVRDAHAEVSRLNRIHAAYLRRSNRTVEVLLNAIGSHALTYARPMESQLMQSLNAGS